MNERKYKNGKRTMWKNLALNLDLGFVTWRRTGSNRFSLPSEMLVFPDLSVSTHALLFLSNNWTWNLDTKKGEHRQTSSPSPLIERSIDAAARKSNHSWDIAFRRDGINEQSSKAGEREKCFEWNLCSFSYLALLFRGHEQSLQKAIDERRKKRKCRLPVGIKFTYVT